MPEIIEQKPARLRILLADDVMATLHSTRLMLRLLPEVEVVATARDGRQAIKMAETHQPDVALVDINMPEVDGLSAIQAMLQYKPEMVCIIMSVEGDDSALQEAKAVGASDYLIKPFTTEELLDAVERAGRIINSRRPKNKQTAQLQRKHTAPLRLGQTSQLREQREVRLQRLATGYIRARQTDDKAVRVLEELAANPDCELHWLKSLVMIYLIRMEWKKLKRLVERLEQQSEPAG